jgi:hypothetical protein
MHLLERGAWFKRAIHLANAFNPCMACVKKADPVKDTGSRKVSPAQDKGDVRTFRLLPLTGKPISNLFRLS